MLKVIQFVGLIVLSAGSALAGSPKDLAEARRESFFSIWEANACKEIIFELTEEPTSHLSDVKYQVAVTFPDFFPVPGLVGRLQVTIRDSRGYFFSGNLNPVTNATLTEPWVTFKVIRSNMEFEASINASGSMQVSILSKADAVHRLQGQRLLEGASLKQEESGEGAKECSQLMQIPD